LDRDEKRLDNLVFRLCFGDLEEENIQSLHTGRIGRKFHDFAENSDLEEPELYEAHSKRHF